MIFSEILYMFRANLELEYVKRGSKQKLSLNDKQLKIIFSTVLSDLQKEFKIIISEKEITTVAGEAAYALDRDFMSMYSVYYETKSLAYKSMKDIYDGITEAGTPTKYGLKWVSGYPYIILNPTPADSGKSIFVKSYNDMKLFSANDGLDAKTKGATDFTYMKIPTMYDVAMLRGMMAEVFDDRIPLYEKEKLRLKSMKIIEGGLRYNMTGVNDEFTRNSYNYNSDADGDPPSLPGEPVIT